MPAAAALICPLAWELSYATGVALKKKKKKIQRNAPEESSHCGLAIMNPTSIHEDMGSIPDLTRWIKDPVLL